jgi:hypothetical protein
MAICFQGYLLQMANSWELWPNSCSNGNYLGSCLRTTANASAAMATI